MRLPEISRVSATTTLPYLALDRIQVSPGSGIQSVQLAGGGGIPPPLTGCWFVGTQCRIGYQSCYYCCGDGTRYSKQCGWCIGWWDAPPCVG